MVETISGSLPLDKRTTLKNMIEHHGGMKTIFVESSRAIARNAKAAEEVYELARLHGVTIIPADVPDLFQPNPTAVQKFVRRCIFAMTELERDLVVDRLRDGRTRAKNARAATLKKTKKTKQHRKAPRVENIVTQSGAVKLGGNTSILQRYRGKLVGEERAKVKNAIKARQGGKFGWRTLGEKLSKILATKMSHMAAKRFANEFSRFFQDERSRLSVQSMPSMISITFAVFTHLDRSGCKQSIVPSHANKKVWVAEAHESVELPYIYIS
jgi:DNA invertase Pin-like site-specific DNA recombinase